MEIILYYPSVLNAIARVLISAGGSESEREDVRMEAEIREKILHCCFEDERKDHNPRNLSSL